MRADLNTLMHMKMEDSMVIVLIFKLYKSLCAYVSRKEHQSIMLFCFNVHSKDSSRKKKNRIKHPKHTQTNLETSSRQKVN